MLVPAGAWPPWQEWWLVRVINRTFRRMIFSRTPGPELVGLARIGYSSERTPGEIRRVSADVAQLVEHHLAKVRVAGSNPVVRSEARLCGILAAGEARSCGGVAEWLRQGPAKPCTRVRFPSPPPSVSDQGNSSAGGSL